MNIGFANKKLRKLCEKSAVAQKELGTDCARKLKTRMDDLEAASCVADLVAGNPHPLRGDRAGQFSVDLAGGWRLVFAPDNEPCPHREDGSIDWSAVTIICIEYIGDYHD